VIFFECDATLSPSSQGKKPATNSRDSAHLNVAERRDRTMCASKTAPFRANAATVFRTM
jgi:hypothetical protein